ncbi:MAG: class I SAM-dependent methyltransferase [Paenisporosarcina sp.]
MTSYTDFARLYDALMTDIPYDQYVAKVLSSFGNPKGKSLLDIGCGTGILSEKFALEGLSVQALDLSEDMLAVAEQRFQNSKMDIPLYCMSMTEMTGIEDLDVAIIAIDSLNYLESETDVKETFSAVYASLKKGGHFFFDVHSTYKMDELFLNGPFTFEDDNLAYIWYTEKGENPHSVYHDLTFFVKNDNGLYERFEESHFQQSFDEQHYRTWLNETGFSTIQVQADWTSKCPSATSERLFFHAIK